MRDIMSPRQTRGGETCFGLYQVLSFQNHVILHQKRRTVRKSGQPFWLTQFHTFFHMAGRFHLQSIYSWHLLESQIKFFICLESKAVNETSLCSTMHADRRKLRLTKLSENNVPSFKVCMWISILCDCVCDLRLLSLQA